ncbi:4-hydroxybenzoate octaprenyltransferase [Pelistega europaea]|uniref:4-hydroxybenzoate octaprenyltransferase n=1 Tax=Pelistega europaea TaxID=106147 RepID=A0A7Y4P5E5_9BURK|nr:4-hydroxybenzoate octaprenyltransferase [Pelistega europaea]NOL48660.1 4-hydroxybenzoate octaprenyltransferase [Pelistega europaea]
MTQDTTDLSDIKPNDWVERYLPKSWGPYARLARLDRPVGTWLTLFPCIAALIQAADGLPNIWRLIVFSLGALLMRSAGSTINDIWDRDFDKHVERTRFRPLTSGQVSLSQAIIFLIVQLLLAASLLFFINPYSRWLALAVVPLVIIYPLCKRFTYWPQAVLGAAFNWGMLMAWTDTTNTLPLAGILMWLGALTWQIGYDTLYAYTDIRDDERLGLKSTARRFGDKGIYWLIGFYIVSILLWVIAGWLMDMAKAYYFVMATVTVHLFWQLKVFDIHNPAQSHMLFNANIHTGILLVIAALAGVF